MGLAERRWLRLFTLCVLYAAQGIPFGFTAVALPAYITSKGVDRTTLALALVMTTLPYTFKWIWGPLMDLVTIPRLGRRRPWVMFAQLMMAATVIAMLGVDVTGDLELLAWVIFVHAVFNSMQDVAVDALAIDLLDDDERGRANGLMYACKYGGVVIGGAGMGRVVGAWGLETALIVQTAILLAIFAVPLIVRERSGPPAGRPPVREVLEGLAQVATLRATLLIALFMLGITLCSGALSVASYGLYIGELRWETQQFTDFVGGLAYAAGFGGSLIGGFLADAIGTKRLVAIASLALAGGWILFAAAQPLWTNDAVIAVFAVLAAVAQSAMIVGSFALCMDATWKRVAATQFAAFMAMQALSSTLGYKLAPLALDLLSYREIYLVAGLVQTSLTLLVLAIDPREVRRLPLAPGWGVNVVGVLTAILVLAAIGVVPVLLLL